MLDSAQITQVKLIAILPTFASAELLTAELNAAEELELVDLIDQWQTVRTKYGYLNGKIAGYVTDPAAQRLAIRNEVRTLLGLPRLVSEIAAATFGITDITTTLKWFY